MKYHQEQNKIILTLLILLIGYSRNVCGGNVHTLPYRLVNTLKNSSSDESRCLYFDHNGQMWIGTSSGLKSFDGYSIHTFKSTVSSPGFLPHNTVLSITEDFHDGLWVGTRNGLVRIDRRTWKTKRYPTLNHDSWIIYTLFTSRDGTVWMGNDAGLSRYVPEKDAFYNYAGRRTWMTDRDGRKRRLGNYSVKSITEDADGNIYVGTWMSGLLKLNRKSNTFIKYPQINHQESAYSLFFDSRKRLWIGTWGYGLVRLDHPNDIRHLGAHIYYKGKGSFEAFYKIIEDPTTRTIWASSREGVHVMSRDGDLHDIAFYSNSGDQTLQQLKFCNDMATDGHGNTWIETLNNGIVHVNTAKSAFGMFNMRNAGYTLPVTSVCTVYSPDGKQIWLTMKPYGVCLYNKVTGKSLFNQQISGINNLPAGFLYTSITGVTKRFNGEIWFANNSFGIASYRPGQPAKCYTMENSSFVKDNFVNTLMQAKNKVMWIGQRTRVSLAYPNNHGCLLKMKDGNDDFTECDARHFFEDSKGRVWISTDNEGIIRVGGDVYHPQTLKFHHYCPSKKNFVVNDATACYEDSHHRLWAISNSGGLFLYNEQADKFISVNGKYGIPGDRIFTINEDGAGNLWMTTDNALICLPNRKSSSITSFGEENGLTQILFYPNASTQNENELYFACQDGFYYFNSGILMRQAKMFDYKLIVTDLLIDDKPYFSVDSTLRNEISDVTPMYARQITIPPSVEKFSVEFAYISYLNQEQIKYAYKLDGYDEDWKHLNGKQHRATYENLPSGTYYLHIVAFDTNGNPHQLPYAVKVRILPPWYASWWAYMVYLLMFVGLACIGIKWYKNYLKTKNRLQMAVVFTNITHELLTPLTVISAAVDDLRGKAPLFEEDYGLMQNNITRLTKLLRQILEVRKSQAGQLKLKVSQGDLAEFVRKSCQNIRPMMGTRNLSFSVECTPDKIEAWFDTDKMDKVIYNLLSNAVKYNRDGGKVVVKLALDNEQYAVLTVTDEGVGMSKEMKKHLYNRFLDGDYRKVNVSGTGIGLSLTHDLIKLHHGTIDCQSVEGKGTTFIVKIPIARDCYVEEEIDGRNKPEKNNEKTIAFVDPPMLMDAEDKFDGDGNEYRILVVEDNEELLELMRRLLSRKYKVYTAKNGRSALNVIYKQELDVVISDVMMPVMDGMELTKEIKGHADFAQLPVVLLTAKTRDEDRNEAYEIGADEYITKPFKLTFLQLRIDNIIANRIRIRRKFSRQTNFKVSEQHYSSPDEVFIQKAIDCVKTHLDDCDYNRETFASDMCVSGSTLYNKLRALTGQSVTGFITSIRLKEACHIIRERKNLQIQIIAEMVGFNNPKYFSKCFKKEFGMLIKDYIERECDCEQKG